MSNRNRLASLSVFVLLAGASGAQAQASRTWVSGVGDDAYPCSRTAPCKTLAGAITKTAEHGEINILDPGSFGTVTITKSLTINGEGQMSGILASGVTGILVNAGTDDVVTIRNLAINGIATGTNGIRILQAKQVHIEDCTIQNFVNRGILADNTSNAIQLFVRDTVVRNNFLGGSATPGISGGILLKPTGTGTVSALLERVTMDQNIFGLRVEGNARATVNDSTASGNTTFGVHAISPGPNAASIILERVVVSNNATGVQAEGSGFASVRLSETMITSNSVGLSSVTGGQLISWGNNRNAGNGTNGAPTGAVTPLQ